jgi:hypothetical protein
MRRHWKRYKPGDERTREYFAWLPVTVRNEHGAETRWLERVKVLEMFQQFKSCDRFWPKRFLDECKVSDIAGKMAEWRKTLWATGPCPDSSQENLTLTDAEKDAVAIAYNQMRAIHADNVAATLRGLLERLGG